MTKEIFKEVAMQCDTTPEIVELVYKSMWSLIRETVDGLPDLRGVSIEDFDNLNANFCIPFFGKLVLEKKRIKRKRELGRYKYCFKNKDNNNDEVKEN